MIEKADLDRVVAEMVQRFTDADPDGVSSGDISAWLEREQISEEGFNYVGMQIFRCWMDSIDTSKPITAETAEEVMTDATAGIMLAFCVGWEACAAYRKPLA